MLFVEVKEDVTKDELKIYVDNFKKLDTNGDGFLDSKEVVKYEYCDPHTPMFPCATTWLHSISTFPV